uniref:Uncharacterized protein n=1 Tax=Amphilophus citrinellus TaxID=61819 RepID=A0A3Q0RRQ6_AMPCI
EKSWYQYICHIHTVQPGTLSSIPTGIHNITSRVRSRAEGKRNDVQDVNTICSNDGRRLTDTATYEGNLCISNSNMLIYDVTFKRTNSGCDINVASDQRPVIVACNKVGNRCLPVHFQKYEHQTPSNIPCSRAGHIMIE